MNIAKKAVIISARSQNSARVVDSSERQTTVSAAELRVSVAEL